MNEEDIDNQFAENKNSTSKSNAVYQGNVPYNSGAVSPPNNSGGFNAMTMVRVILHRWITVGLLGLFGGLIGVFYTQKAIPVYRAQAELEMSVRRPKVINNDAVFEDPSSGQNSDVIFNTRFAKFLSPAMESLASKEYITQYPDHKETIWGETINRYSLALWTREAKWNKDPNANIVYVKYEASDPEFSAQLVNVLSHCAGMLMMQENQAQSDEAVKWLVSQVKDQRLILEEGEKELTRLREELQLDALQQRKIALSQTLVTISQEKESLISNISSRRTIYNFVVELKETDPNLEMLPSGLPKERELNQLLGTWRMANDTLLKAGDRYTKIHPEYRRAAEIESRSRTRLEQFIDLSAKTVKNEVELLEKQIEQTDLRANKMKTEALDLELELASGLRQVQQVERKRNAADLSYQAMLRRMEEARLSADENMAFAKIIRKARVPEKPISPKVIPSVVAGIIFGMGLGAFFALISALWTDKIAAVADLKALNLNILATIPSQKKVDSRIELATIGLRDKFNPIVEIFAGINGLISSQRYSEHTSMIVCCSVGPGEGKTISACNLAISSALNGTKTLLIDGDLRRPQLYNIFNINEDHISLIDLLAKDADVNHSDLLTKDIVENLDLITSLPNGEINPAELLGRNSLASLLNWARKNYDRVIIDSPPLGPVGDALIYANHADVVLLVSRIGQTKRRGLVLALNRFRTAGIPLLGCIANDVPHSLSGMFGGGEGYGYSYGGYGYSSKGKD